MIIEKNIIEKALGKTFFWCAKIALILHTRYIVPGLLAQKLSRIFNKNGPRIILVRNSFISGRNSSSKIKRTFFSITQIYYRVYNEKITISFSREFSSGELNYLSNTISCRVQEKELKCDSELNSKYIDLHLVHLLFCNRILSYPSKDDGCVFFFYQILSRLKPWKKK